MILSFSQEKKEENRFLRNFRTFFHSNFSFFSSHFNEVKSIWKIKSINFLISFSVRLCIHFIIIIKKRKKRGKSFQRRKKCSFFGAGGGNKIEKNSPKLSHIDFPTSYLFFSFFIIIKRERKKRRKDCKRKERSLLVQKRREKLHHIRDSSILHRIYLIFSFSIH